jgi:NAD(P)-dependent dehydrogenase (short-subunit alcohol dehydrogenase family)
MSQTTVASSHKGRSIQKQLSLKTQNTRKKSYSKIRGSAKARSSESTVNAKGSGRIEPKPPAKAKSKISRRVYRKAPMPAQHQEKPGIESKLNPKPKFKAPHYKGSEKLKNKTALITGGDSGIGRATAVLYAREGADVAIIYLAEEESDAQATAKAVKAEGGQALLIPGDVTDPTFCIEAVEKVVSEWGHLDILVNNAAYQLHVANIEELSLAQWDLTFKTNIYGYFYMARAAVKHMKPGSAIINCGSVTGIRGSKELLDYASTKGAIHAFTKSLAQHLIDRGIRVNAIAPGPVWTPLNPADRDAKSLKKFGANTPMERPAQPEEIAPSFVFLASSADSSYITGEVLPVLGGSH